MKFVALLSGGKDSCLNILKCVENGHELVCLANLFPVAVAGAGAGAGAVTVGPVEEVNSFMYQSAGHSVIPYQAQCMGVPLYRQGITRPSLVQSLEYETPSSSSSGNGATNGTGTGTGTDGGSSDEVEDMFDLLQEVLRHHPDVKGVSCGAIVSNYQRIRLEHVCNRLGLIPLTYLWQRERGALLDEVIDYGVHAILVKVAGAGLDPYKHLGKTLAALKPTLLTLHARFGLDLCGEGGEFETFVLDCPKLFKHGRIEIEQSEVLLDDEDPTVGNLLITKCKVAAATAPSIIPSSTQRASLLNASISKHAGIFIRQLQPLVTTQPTTKVISKPTCYWTAHTLSVSMGRDGLLQTSLIHPNFNCPSIAEGSESLADMAASQLRSCFEQLQTAFTSYGIQLADCLFMHLYIADISLFAAVNTEYCKWFGRHPPSRSCVAVPLAKGSLVALDALACVGSYQAMIKGRSTQRKVLHIQCMSEWAPMCIGPYSQANVIKDAYITVAGQIPLVPGTMDLLQTTPPSDSDASSTSSSHNSLTALLSQTELCLHNAAQVLGCLGSSLHYAMTVVVYVNTSHELYHSIIQESAELLNGLSDLASIIVNFVQQLLSVNAGCPLISANSDLSSGAQAFSRDVHDVYQSDPEEDDEEDHGGEDSEGVVNRQNGTNGPMSIAVPVLVVGVKGIPRNAAVEVEAQATSSTLRRPITHHRASVTIGDSENDSEGGKLFQPTFLMPTATVTSLQSPVRNIDWWPLWPGNQLTSNPPKAMLANGATAQLVSIWSKIDQAMCSGFVEVRMSQKPVSAGSVNLGLLMSAVTRQLASVFVEAQMSVQQRLRTLRVYLPTSASNVDTVTVRHALSAALREHCELPLDFPVVDIPVTSTLTGGAVLVIVQFVAIDLAQCVSESWIK